jgi:hypothetical protein
VPEIVDRIRLLTGHVGPARGIAGVVAAASLAGPLAASQLLTTGPVLLTGYSQGSIISAAVLAQLPAEVRRSVALLTLACPARRLYGRAFPGFFGPDRLTELAELCADGPDRWQNVARRSDFIGSWVLQQPTAGSPGRHDHLSLDPSLARSSAAASTPASCPSARRSGPSTSTGSRPARRNDHEPAPDHRRAPCVGAIEPSACWASSASAGMGFAKW